MHCAITFLGMFLKSFLPSVNSLTKYGNWPNWTNLYISTLYISGDAAINTSEILGSNLFTEFVNEIQNSPFGYIDFYLNFGSNQLIIANNILLDNSNPTDPTILIKLYDNTLFNPTLIAEYPVTEKINNKPNIIYNNNTVGNPSFNRLDDSLYFVSLDSKNINFINIILINCLKYFFLQ
mgnify:CR=1 FL=1